MPLSKEQIISANDFTIKEIPVPEWGGSVLIKLMSARDRERWETDIITHKYNVRTSLLVRSICDEHGNNLFTLKEVEELGKKNSHVIDMLFDEVQALNKVGKGDLDALGEALTPTEQEDSASS